MIVRVIIKQRNQRQRLDKIVECVTVTRWDDETIIVRPMTGADITLRGGDVERVIITIGQERLVYGTGPKVNYLAFKLLEGDEEENMPTI